MADLYIWIPNWDGSSGFQHYRNRDPIWIKNYTRLLSHDEYLSLSSRRRGILHGIWLAYANSNRRLPGLTSNLSSRLNVRVLNSDLTALSEAGFIEVIASSVLAERLQDASLEVEVEKEKNTDRQTERRDTTPDTNIDFDDPELAESRRQAARRYDDLELTQGLVPLAAKGLSD